MSEANAMHKLLVPFRVDRNPEYLPFSEFSPEAFAPTKREEPAQSEALDELLTEALNGSNYMTSCIVGVANTSLPVLEPAPGWLLDFARQFSTIKGHVLTWLYSISAKVASLPAALIGSSRMIQMNLAAVRQGLTMLQTAPDNRLARNQLAHTLKDMTNLVRGQLQLLRDLNASVGKSLTLLIEDQRRIEAAVEEMTRAMGPESRRAIEQATRAFDLLHDAIDRERTLVKHSTLASGLSFYSDAIVVPLPLGAKLGFGLMGSSPDCGSAVASKAEVRAAFVALSKALQDEFGPGSTGHAALPLIYRYFSSLCSAVQRQLERIGTLVHVWEQLERDLSAIASQLQSARSDVVPPDASRVQADLNQAVNAWQTLPEVCDVLARISHFPSGRAVSELSFPDVRA